MEILRRFPTAESIRPCRSCLSAQGFHDITPDGIVLRSWTSITSVRWHEGDLYVWCRLTGGHFIPRSAWNSPEEGQAFYDSALRLWESNGLCGLEEGKPSVPEPDERT